MYGRVAVAITAVAISIGVAYGPVAGSEAALTDPAGYACTDLAPSAIVSYPDGGADYQFTTPDGKTVHMPKAPRGFRPERASDALLHRYGFPPRPAASRDHRAWDAAMTAYRSTPTPTLCWNSARPPSLSIGSGTNSLATTGLPNWAGYVASSTFHDGYTEAAGRWAQPARGTTTCAGARESAWAGIGGFRARDDRSAGLIQAGTAYGTTGTPYAWWEYLGLDQSGTKTGVAEQRFAQLTIRPGDTVEAFVYYDIPNRAATFYVENVTLGEEQAAYQNISTLYWDGRGADWIVERPSTINGTLVPLQNFTQIHIYDAQVLAQASGWHYLAATPAQTIVNMTASSQRFLAITGSIGGADGDAFNSYFQSCS